MASLWRPNIYHGPYCSITFTHLKAKGTRGLEVFLPLPADPPCVKWAAFCVLFISAFGKFLVWETEWEKVPSVLGTQCLVQSKGSAGSKKVAHQNNLTQHQNLKKPLSFKCTGMKCDVLEVQLARTACPVQHEYRGSFFYHEQSKSLKLQCLYVYIETSSVTSYLKVVKCFIFKCLLLHVLLFNIRDCYYSAHLQTVAVSW